MYIAFKGYFALLLKIVFVCFLEITLGSCMQQNTHALRIQEHYLTWEDAINSVDLVLSLQKRVEKMRSHFPTMHTSTPEIYLLPGKFIACTKIS
jgi:hypothetical protein